MSRILLVRHGQTAWNAAGKLQGHTDIELDEVGRAQARAIADSVRALGVAGVWSSDLLRARETAEIAAASLGLPSPRIDPELRERRFGMFEGLTRDECATKHPEAWKAWLDRTAVPQGGEDRTTVLARMTRVLNRVIANTDGLALVVSHGGVMRLWLTEHVGASIGPITNGAMHAVEHDGARFRVSPVSG